MKKEFKHISDTTAFEQLLVLSHDGPVILFKHSSTCPVSAAAYDEMSRIKTDVSLLVVQRAREVSREVEARTGVRHESPQTIILRNGQAVWNASHWNIKTDAVEQALRNNS